MGKVLDIVNQKVVPIIEKLGYEVVDVEYKKEYGDMNLTFFIYKPEGISLDDCELVTKAIDGLLDEANPTDDIPYVLNVSSPGLDRPIKTERDFARSIGTEVEIKLYTLMDKKKIFNGILLAKNDKELILNIEGTEKIFPIEKISLIRPYVKFN